MIDLDGLICQTAPLEPVASRIGMIDLAWIVLDTLRFDVAETELRAGRTPLLAALAGPAGWERRHTPGTFTYPAHQAFFAGFLPTPAAPGRHPRSFAAAFPGSETTSESTWVFHAPTVVEALAEVGYATRCIGGVGFFNPATAIGAQFPGLFQQSHYSEATSVTGRDPLGAASGVLDAWEGEDTEPSRPRFTYVNVAALHQPNHWYLDGIDSTPQTRPADSIDSHAAALRYVDAALAPVLRRLVRPGRDLALWVFSDHGTCYGEDGYNGHRIAHPVVTTVPYLETLLRCTR